MRETSTMISTTRRVGLLPMLALTALTAMAVPAPAQTPPNQRPTTKDLVTKADLAATGAQLRQKITAQGDDLAALRQQLLTLQAQVRALDRQVNGMKVPAAPTGSRIIPRP